VAVVEPRLRGERHFRVQPVEEPDEVVDGDPTRAERIGPEDALPVLATRVVGVLLGFVGTGVSMRIGRERELPLRRPA
jgi:hypothetical protein